MPGYKTRKLQIDIGAFSGRLRALRDRNQYAKSDSITKSEGISSANWSLFGQLWPASLVLAGVVKKLKLKERRILELGCGLGLPSLILQWRGANITASDHHPLSKDFLDYNAALNDLPNVPYLHLPWSETPRDIGRFELILGSDILYERDHPAQLAELVQVLAAPSAKVLITCPGRRYRNQFSRAMKEQGFQLNETRLAFEEGEVAPYRGRLLSYQRHA
ncbi:SAM-dependent methyltransferase [Parahaliea sp. F7430]|uniref:SAM-dependent methyltransferase n=1 Tax=Sediminihaliea albiluteola TaxID=2758564 RepID=A0A7W2TTW1_9GAMM|nr:SAM-dependent methyltransferase [Sediminihaliea albiluteola]MBA6411793.1 SAM-dependent methyltransferase [Sediminihaliea albiluteola]